MIDKKIFTYVSPQTAQEVLNSMCSTLPIDLRPVGTIEELFPLLSDPNFHTDFVGISIEMFQGRADNLDMFDIVHTLNTLIKSTVCRKTSGGRVRKRDTKIFVVVDERTDPKLVKEVLQFPAIATVSWLLTKEEDYQSVLEHAERLIAGDMTPHPKVLEMLRPKKKLVVKKTNEIELTTRQSQVLQLVRDRGASNKTIARILDLSESTVKLHMGAILKKYGVKNRTQLAVFSKETS